MSPLKDFMSLEEVAELLGVNYQLIYKLVRSGELPAARIGKVYRVAGRDLQQFIEKSMTTSSGATCSACGREYQSRLSVSHECERCGAPICFDCWTRRQVRHCREHAAANKNPQKRASNTDGESG